MSALLLAKMPLPCLVRWIPPLPSGRSSSESVPWLVTEVKNLSSTLAVHTIVDMQYQSPTPCTLSPHQMDEGEHLGTHTSDYHIEEQQGLTVRRMDKLCQSLRNLLDPSNNFF